MVLAGWLAHYQPDEETRRLIAEALDWYANDERQPLFKVDGDFSNPRVTVIEPEAKLTVHVHPRGTEQFTLVRIIDERNWKAD
jgi:hypothetical protein